MNDPGGGGFPMLFAFFINKHFSIYNHMADRCIPPHTSSVLILKLSVYFIDSCYYPVILDHLSEMQCCINGPIAIKVFLLV